MIKEKTIIEKAHMCTLRTVTYENIRMHAIETLNF